MKRTRHITRLVTILCAAIFIFGCTSTVFGATDLVGRATGNGSSTSTTTRTTTGTTGTTRTYNGTGSTTTVANGTETTGYMPSTVATTTNTKGAAVTVPTTSRVRTQVQTGVMDKILPFVLVISAAVMVFWIFFHFQMNQVRYGKSEKYYKELLDFKVMCKN